MTAPAPSPESPQEAMGVERSGPSRKAVIGWTVGMLLVLALAAGGGLSYKTLKLRYAIYKARQYPPILQLAPPSANKWQTYCLQEACRGSEEAMALMVEQGYLCVASVGQGRKDLRRVAYVVATSQPELFLRTLENGERNRAFRGLWHFCNAVIEMRKGYGASLDPSGGAPAELRALRSGLKGLSSDREAKVRRIARSGLEIIERRFADQITANKTGKRSGTPE